MNGGTILLVAGGGGGGGGGGNYGGGADGGGGGQSGNPSTSAAGGVLGASGTNNGLTGATTSGDGAGAGGGGGGLNGGGGGSVPGSDMGGAGGAGGTSQGTTINNGSPITPGNSGSPNLCAGCAKGGTGAPNGGTAMPGGPGVLLITYTAAPPPSVSANASATSVCSGQPVTLTGSGASSYTWTGGVTDGVPFTPSATNTYTVTGSSGACSGTATISVVVNSSPTVTVNSGSFCTGGSVVLNASSTSPVTYTWGPSAGLSATTGGTVTANPSSTTVYTVVGVDGNLCFGFATSTVTVNSLPVVSATSGTVCGGAAITLTASGANTYNWNPGTGLSSTTGNTVTASPPSNTIYTVTGTDVNGCVSTATSTVTVNPLPVPTASVNSPVCQGGTINFTGSGGLTYTWSSSLGSYSAQNPSVPNAQPNMSGTYTLTVTDNNGCTAQTTTQLVVNALPPVSVNSATICLSNTAALNASGATSYSWSPGSGLSATSGANVNASPTTTTVYTVTGTDGNGCVNTASSTVTVNAALLVSANSATICPGTTATLTASGSNSYSWNTGATTAGITVSPGSTTVYTVTATDVNGCTSVATPTVLVNPPLVLSPQSNSPQCQGNTLNFFITTGISWNWNGPQGFFSTQANPSILNAQPNMSGTYTVSGMDANGCTDTTTINATVNPLPVVTPSSNSPICQGATLNLTGTAASTYSWSGPASYSSNQQSPFITSAQPNMSGTYTLALTDNNGCVNSGAVQVTINANPVVSVNSPTLCAGNSVTLSASGAVNYSWTPSTGLSGTSGSSVTANPTTSTNYIVTGIDGNLCSGSDTAVVTVYQLPTVSVSSATICANSTATLTATGASLYSWSPATGLSSTNGSPVLASPSSTTSYSIQGTDLHGCVSSTTCTVKVNPLPNVKISPQTTSGCAPLLVSFSNAGASQGSCSWSFGDGTTSNTSCLPTHIFSTAGTYTVDLQLTDSNGCVNHSQSLVVIYPVPHADFNATPQPTTILDPTIHFYDASTLAPITSWSWNFGDGDTSKIEFPTHVYQDTGSYPVQLTVVSSFGCRDSIIKIIVIQDEYVVYVPNAFTPNYDGTNDVFLPKGTGIADYKLWVYDRWGELVFYSEDPHTGWDGRMHNHGSQILQQDVYAWKLEVTNEKGEPRMFKGTVSLIK
jgi:gliding motility-associated-like protein